MKYKLDDEEKDIVESYDAGEWYEEPDMDSEKKRYVEYAKATYKKDKRLNIRISSKDLDSIQRIAIDEGIPYQTLISSIIHKYISIKLVEKTLKRRFQL